MTQITHIDAFTLLYCEIVANYVLVLCKNVDLKIRSCKFLDKSHVWAPKAPEVELDGKIGAPEFDLMIKSVASLQI